MHTKLFLNYTCHHLITSTNHWVPVIILLLKLVLCWASIPTGEGGGGGDCRIIDGGEERRGENGKQEDFDKNDPWGVWLVPMNFQILRKTVVLKL